MERTVEEVKEEAIKRMKKLKLHSNVLKEFVNGTLNESEGGGCLYWLDESEKKIVEQFEEDHKAVVYHVIHQLTNIGELYSLLYVNYDDEEWEVSNKDLDNGEALAYVYNNSFPDCSELGYIGIRPQIGGLVRAW